jgi:RND family efflux transporter MFP subunit
VEAAAGQGGAVTVQVESQVAEVYVQSGETVREGQALLRLQASAVTALDAGKAEGDARSAQVELQRLSRLREQGLATESELQVARAAAASATALRDSLAARAGGQQGLTLQAPVDGVVDGLTARPGEVLAAGTVVARVMALTSRGVRLGVEPDALDGLRVGADVELWDLHEVSRGAGHVVAIDRRVDAQSGLAAVLVRAESVAVGPLGTRLRARIIRDRHVKAPGVPRSAVLFDGDRAAVFVVVGGKAQRRDVKLGFRDSNQIEILAGVSQGEQVVVLGNDELKDGMAVHVAAGAADPKT